MPPGPAYNWFCVLYSTAEILSHAARYRATQLTPKSSSFGHPRKRRRTEDATDRTILERVEKVEEVIQIPVEPSPSRPARVEEENLASEPVSLPADRKVVEAEVRPVETISLPDASERTEKQIANPIEATVVSDLSAQPSEKEVTVEKQACLAASLGYGVASEVLRRTGSGSSQEASSPMMTEANIKRLVSKLTQMRGAALKLGQFMSIQDTHILPPDLDRIFRRVQDSAHYMPDWQMEQVMTAALGPSWSQNFASFDRIPFAAASIGQVHQAVLAESVSPTGKEERVAVKVQFPNIGNSIESDLGYIKLLLTAGKLLPKGLFLDKTISVMKKELADECDYVREASFLKRFGSREYLGDDPRFKVPWVWEGSTSTVLVMERVDGVSVGEANAANLSQEDRNDISARIIELCLRELFDFRAMQTDPNWTNFLWNAETRQVELVDFGATRTYSKEFMDKWLGLLQAAASGDRDACREWSLKLGYLTGEENEVRLFPYIGQRLTDPVVQIMLNAHITSMTLLATPFKAETPQPFYFGPGSQWADATAQIRSFIPIMLQHRLTPPPQETYSLNRKLSGAFLLASRLGAKIDTKAIWDKVVGKYEVG
ncbi:hypothetical protein CVT26_012451 [Gymnopilus dilepis]|uniref:ABC1 atypical kinase-like domain-containing protein n=1 Tax=Gymnopilus dilepis TaxID=231916 RepID=A0A409YCU1_9AGAR|nr:hypothetical protein CVT26_012451 [Gymnopilus dilepis]